MLGAVLPSDSPFSRRAVKLACTKFHSILVMVAFSPYLANLDRCVLWPKAKPATKIRTELKASASRESVIGLLWTRRGAVAPDCSYLFGSWKSMRIKLGV